MRTSDVSRDEFTAGVNEGEGGELEHKQAVVR